MRWGHQTFLLLWAGRGTAEYMAGHCWAKKVQGSNRALGAEPMGRCCRKGNEEGVAAELCLGHSPAVGRSPHCWQHPAAGSTCWVNRKWQTNIKHWRGKQMLQLGMQRAMFSSVPSCWLWIAIISLKEVGRWRVDPASHLPPPRDVHRVSLQCPGDCPVPHEAQHQYFSVACRSQLTAAV